MLFTTPMLRIRILKYGFLSDLTRVEGRPVRHTPVLLESAGTIIFGQNVHLGVVSSPYAFTGYSYISARAAGASIVMGDDVYLNNHAVLISEGEGIEIGSRTLIGFNFCAVDSDFHDLNPHRRLTGIPKTKKIEIGRNVFIGSNVTVLKGAVIGDNSVIGAGSVVSGTIPPDVIAAGNPCRVIRGV